MKKLLYSVSTALLLLSCDTEDPSLEAEPGKGGNMITFVGRTFPETRTEIGVKDGNSYPVLWSSGDRIGIISPVETLFQNASATLNASDAGKNSGMGLSYGVGASWGFTPNIAAVLEWERHRLRFSDDTAPADMATVGVRYKF